MLSGLSLLPAYTAQESANSDIETTNQVAMLPVGGSQSESEVSIWVHVPHTLRPVDNFIAFPYPMKPPTIAKPIEPIEIKSSYLKSMLFSLGYANRIHQRKPFMIAGWRWRYAYDAALKKSKLSEPPTVVAAYSWSKDMVPYVRKELVRLNAIEAERKARYLQAVSFHDTQSAEIESAAALAGMQPVDISLNRLFQRKIKLKPGNWWITGTHRVPGLVYYWQLPITVAAGQPLKVELTEENALVIQGGW